MGINVADFGSPPEHLQQFPAGNLAARVVGNQKTFGLLDSLQYMGVKPECFDNIPSLMANRIPGKLHDQPIAGLGGEANGELTITFK